MQHADLVHPTAVHPHTGEPLRAIGILKSGRVVWPVMGAAEGDGTTDSGNGNGTENGGGDGKVFTQADLDAAISKAAAGIRESERNKVTRELTEQAAAKTQTAEQRIAELQKTVEATRLEALRSKIQARYGINDEDATLFLTGSDEETLDKQGKRLKEQADERAMSGGRNPREGGNTRPVVNEEKQVVKTLFGNGG